MAGLSCESVITFCFIENLRPEQYMKSLTDYQRKYAMPLRELLIDLSRRGGEKITYSDAANVLGIWQRIQSLLSAVGHHCQDNGEPILTALVVSKATGECSSGLEAEFGITNPAAERQKCAEYWRQQADEPTDEIARRAVRFAVQATRPEQAAFRRAVFERYNGKCALTGCEIACLLDAAHLPDRNWREGHNDAADGILLRADLHRLLDSGHIALAKDGSIEMSAIASNEYGQFSASCWLPGC